MVKSDSTRRCRHSFTRSYVPPLSKSDLLGQVSGRGRGYSTRPEGLNSRSIRRDLGVAVPVSFDTE